MKWSQILHLFVSHSPNNIRFLHNKLKVQGISIDNKSDKSENILQTIFIMKVK